MPKPYKIVNNSSAGTADSVGGNDWDEVVTDLNAQSDAYNYFIYKDGSNYIRVRGSDGSQVSNTSFATIINGAIDAVTALANGGKIILGGETTFTLAVSAVINLKSKVTIEGLEYGARITKADSGNAISILGTAGNEVVNWAVKNLRITGPSVVGTQVAGDGIFADYADKGLIENCDISGFGVSGASAGSIHLRRCEQVTITKCRLHDSANGFITSLATGVTFPETELCKITESYCHNNFDDGMHPQHSVNISMTNNHVFLNSEAGIDLLGDHGDTITGNIVYDNVGNGIEIGNTTASNNPDRYHTITGNTSRDNGGEGISLNYRSEYCVVSANTCKNNASGGIETGGNGVDTSKYHTITSNVCEGNTSHGIHINTLSDYTIINGNMISGNTGDGINVANSDKLIINGNVLRANGSYGLEFEAATCTNEIITSNQFKDNTTGTILNGGQTGNVEANNNTA